MLENIPKVANNVQEGTNMIQESPKIYDEIWLFASLVKYISYLIHVNLLNLSNLQVLHGYMLLFRRGVYFSQPINGFL